MMAGRQGLLYHLQQTTINDYALIGNIKY
jgi:hypothetical protein